MSAEHTYWVISPECCLYPGGEYEPPEFGGAVAYVRASSKREAIREAVDHADMRPWVYEARLDRRNPFAGLSAYLAHCEHGTRLCFDDEDDFTVACTDCARLADGCLTQADAA